MKRKTSNTERRIIRCIGEDRAKEVAPVYAAMRQTDSTPNAQRPTSNAQGKTNLRFNLEDRLLDFSTRIIRLVDALPNTRAANHLAGQILRSGTSPYGNHGEVEAAESRKDFVHKLKVCLKELKETRRWLRLVKKSKMLPEKNMVPILAESEEVGPNFFRQRPDGREKLKMTSRFSSLGVGRWALDVGSFALLLSILHAFAAQVFAGFGPGTHFPTMTP
jgi:four helix bundle protein